MDKDYRGYTLYENVGPLAMAQRPGVFTATGPGIQFTGTTEECFIHIDYVVALKAFQAAHNGVTPEEAHDYADLIVRQDLLEAYQTAYNADYMMQRARYDK